MGQLIQFPTPNNRPRKNIYVTRAQEEFVNEAVFKLESMCDLRKTSSISVETMQKIVNEFYRHNDIVTKSTRKDK